MMSALIEPHLQSVNGEQLSSNVEDNARQDIAANRFWGRWLKYLHQCESIQPTHNIRDLLIATERMSWRKGDNMSKEYGK